MSRWFRLYAKAMRDPKVMRLPDKDFRLWIRLLAVASEHGGSIPALDDLKLVLSARLDHLSTGLDRLISAGLIDVLDDGYEPHNWSKFQYKSDTSTDRVRRHRKNGNVSETPPDTDTDTDTEDTLAKANGAAAPSEEDSDQRFWSTAKAFIRPEVKGDPGRVIGKWVRDHGKADTVTAISRAQVERPVQRIPFIEGCFRAKARDPTEWVSPC